MPTSTDPAQKPKTGPCIAYVAKDLQGDHEQSQFIVFSETEKVPVTLTYGAGQTVKDYLKSLRLSLRRAMEMFPNGIVPSFNRYQHEMERGAKNRLSPEDWAARNQQRIDEDGWENTLSTQWLLNMHCLQILANHIGLPIAVFIHNNGDDGDPAYSYTVTPDK